MRRLRFGVALVLIGALAALVAGCGGSDPNEARTPANAPTVTNGQAPVTTTEGETVTGDAGGATTGTTPTTPPATAPPAGGAGGGDTAAIGAGKTFFEGTCQVCHAAGGTQAGVGPKLAGTGLTADRVKNQVINGGGAMPPGLATGDDLENVTKFVVSLQ